MKKYTEMNHEELLALKKELDKEFEEIKALQDQTGISDCRK